MTTQAPPVDGLDQMNPDGPSLRQVERLLRDKDFSQAIHVCRESLEQKPEPLAEVEWRLLLGRAYLMSGQAQQSVPQLLRVTQLHPTEPNVYVYLGTAYNQLTLYQRAVEALTQALRLNPSSFGTYFNLGVAHGRLGDLPLAKTALREALVIQPNSADAHFQLASVYLQLSAAGLAATHFQKALAIRPNFQKAQAGLTRATMLSAAGSGVYLNPLERIAPAHAHKANRPALAEAHPKSTELDPDAVRFLSNEITRATNELRQQLENSVVPLLNGMRRLVIEGKGHFPDFLQHHTDFRATCLRIAEARKKIRRLTLKILTSEELQTS